MAFLRSALPLVGLGVAMAVYRGLDRTSRLRRI
jgi:hypothetical protein